MKGLLISTFALVLAASPVSAACIAAEPSRVATVQVTSCSSTAEVAETKLGGVDLPWVTAHVNRAVGRHEGVVVAGFMTRKVHVEQYGKDAFRILDVMPSDETGAWFVRGERLSCEAFETRTYVELYVSEKCCDVFPPMDIPCLLDLGQAQPVGESLRAVLKAAGM